MCLKDLFRSEHISSNLNIKTALIEISYDAYSTDSSFGEVLDLQFCPTCGGNLKTIAKKERVRLYLQERKRIKKAKEDKEKRLKLEAERIENNKLARIKDFEAGNYYIFSNGVKEIKAANKKHLREISGLSHKQSKEYVGIKHFINGRENKAFKPSYKGDKNEKKNNFSVNYDINKNADINSEICCTNCGKVFIKKTRAHAFCEIKCKDDYWNKVRK